MLVAPPDVESDTHATPEAHVFRPMPMRPHSFPSVVVASSNDPRCNINRARGEQSADRGLREDAVPMNNGANGRARRCAVTPVVAHHVQGQATQWRDLSTLRTFTDTSGSCA
jgi:hypothetical protein